MLYEPLNCWKVVKPNAILSSYTSILVNLCLGDESQNTKFGMSYAEIKVLEKANDVLREVGSRMLRDINNQQSAAKRNM